MAWNNTNLASALGKVVTDAQSTLSDANKNLTQAQAQLNKVNTTLNTLVNSVTLNQSLVNKIQASGFYFITLSPKVGSWNSRLAAATNAPPNTGYSCGTASVMISSDPIGLLQKYTNVLQSLIEPLDMDSIIDPFDWDPDEFTPFEGGSLLDDLELPELPTLDSLLGDTEDRWDGVSLGDVFSGATNGIINVLNSSKKLTKSTGSIYNQVGKRKSAISKGIRTTNTFLGRLTGTGVYTITLPPAAGGYLSRLQSEAGHPPSWSDSYSAGFVCVTVAAGIQALQSKYEALQGILG